MPYEIRCWIKVAYIGLCNSFPHFYKRWWGRNWIGLSNCRNVMQKVTYKYALNITCRHVVSRNKRSVCTCSVLAACSYSSLGQMHRHCLLFDNSAWNYSNLGYKIFQSTNWHRNKKPSNCIALKKCSIHVVYFFLSMPNLREATLFVCIVIFKLSSHGLGISRKRTQTRSHFACVLVKWMNLIHWILEWEKSGRSRTCAYHAKIYDYY